MTDCVFRTLHAKNEPVNLGELIKLWRK